MKSSIEQYQIISPGRQFLLEGILEQFLHYRVQPFREECTLIEGEQPILDPTPGWEVNECLV